MTFLQLTEYLGSHGLTVAVDAGRYLDIRGNLTSVTREIAEAIRSHKSALIEWSSQSEGPCTDNPSDTEAKLGDTDASCPVCHGINLVTDSIGKYCIDCQRRPNQPAVFDEPAVASPKRLQVSWGEHDAGVSWVKLRHPKTGETCEIRAKGLDDRDKWIFGHIPPKKKHGTRLRFEPDHHDLAKTEKDRIRRELERQQWDDEILVRMKKAAENMSCAMCHRRVEIDYVSGLCIECENK